MRRRGRARSRAVSVLASVLVLLLLLVVGGPSGWAQPTCKGTKQYYQGACRYPDTIQRLKAEAAQRQAAADRAKAAAAACKLAREADTVVSWQAYQRDYPEGECQDEAAARIAALEAAEPVEDPEEPAEPPLEEPLEPGEPAPLEADDGEISPLAWVGFAVGGAGVVVWAVAGGISLSRESDLAGACPEQRCAADRQDDIDSANLAADVATAGVVVGGAGLAFGLVALIASLASGEDDGDHEEPATESEGEPAAESAVTLRPVVGLGAVGLRGEF